MFVDDSQGLAEPEPLAYSETEQEFLAPIDRAHAFASRTLLDFILKQKDLKGILKWAHLPVLSTNLCTRSTSQYLYWI